MRKIRNIICGLLTSVFIFSTIFSSNAYAFEPTSISYTHWSDGIFYVEDVNNITQSDIDMHNYILGVTPSATLDFFRQANVKIHLTHSVSVSDLSLGSSYIGGACLAASFSYNNSTYQIANISTPVEIYIYSVAPYKDAYIHECGHAFDLIAEYITGYYPGPHPISSSAEWQNLYAQNASILATFDTPSTNNVTRDYIEGFAEAYRFYYEYPTQLQSSCPDVYNFITNQIAKYQAYVVTVTYENFDYELYYRTYPDVAAAFGLDKDALWNHYVTFGKSEGRHAGIINK